MTSLEFDMFSRAWLGLAIAVRRQEKLGSWGAGGDRFESVNRAVCVFVCVCVKSEKKPFERFICLPSNTWSIYMYRVVRRPLFSWRTCFSFFCGCFVNILFPHKKKTASN